MFRFVSNLSFASAREEKFRRYTGKSNEQVEQFQILCRRALEVVHAPRAKCVNLAKLRDGIETDFRTYIIALVH